MTARFDYDDIGFYNEIFNLASQGLTDAEIADGLNGKDGEGLSPSTFSAMKNGNYALWSDEENERRSKMIRQAIERGARRIISAVRSQYLKLGLGGKKVKTRTVVRRKMKVGGVYTDDEEIQTTETETELPPSAAVLARYLLHHDAEWRKIERGEEEREESKAPDINITVTYNKVEDLEMQVKREPAVDGTSCASGKSALE